MPAVDRVKCDMFIQDADIGMGVIVRRRIRATFSLEGQDVKRCFDGTLVGAPGDGMVLERFYNDEIGLGSNKGWAALAALHREAGGDEELDRITLWSVSCEFHVSEGCWVDDVVDALVCAISEQADRES